MSNGDDVLDNWEEIDEAGLSNKLDKLQAEIKTHQQPEEFLTEFTEKSSTVSLKNTKDLIFSTAIVSDSSQYKSFEEPIIGGMKLLQRSSMQDNSNMINLSASTTSAAMAVATDVLKSPLEDMASSFQPVMMLLNKTNDEYESANYTQSFNAQTVKILRRPTQSSEPRNNEPKPKQPIKTLKQREQEYAEARLRILGAAKNPDDDVVAGEGENVGAAGATASVNNLPNNTKSPTSTNAAAGSVATASVERYTNRSNGTKNHLLASPPNQFINNTNNNNGGIYYYNQKPQALQQQQQLFQQQFQQFQQNNFFYPALYMQQMQQQPQQQQQQQQQHQGPVPPPPANVYNSRSMTMLPPPPLHQYQQAQLVLQQQQQPPQPPPSLTWSPIVGGNVSATNLIQQQARNENVLRLPRGPDGSNGFQVRR